MKRIVSILALALILSHAAADDAAMEARYRALIAELRCLVCQNQSLADSDAELAADMRRVVREQLQQGNSDAEVVAYLVARFGDFVRYRPPFKPVTWVLWLGPALALAAGLWVVRRQLRLHHTVPRDPAKDGTQT